MKSILAIIVLWTSSMLVGCSTTGNVSRDVDKLVVLNDSAFYAQDSILIREMRTECLTYQKDTISYSNDEQPRLLHSVLPEIPGNGFKEINFCETIVEILVDKTGQPIFAEIINTLDPNFNKVSLIAAMKYRFSIAKIKGVSVPALIRIPFRFKSNK